MSEDNISRKKRGGWVKQSRLDPRTAEERRPAIQNDPSSPLPLKNHRGLLELVPKFLGKVIHRSAPSARQSPNPESALASSSAQGLLPVQIIKDLSPVNVPIPEPNPDRSSDSGIAKVEQPDPKFVKERIADATKGIAGVKNVSEMVQDITPATNDLIPAAIDTFSAILGPLKAFNSIASGLADLHPYAKMALSIFTCAAKMILDQAQRDDDVLHLLTKISEVYAFMKEDEALAKIQSMLAIYGKIARQILECADFIVHYSETKSAWTRLGKYVVNERDTMIQSYSVVLDSLMQQFRDQATRDAVIILHRAGEDLDLSGMVYSDGAGFDTSKRCLAGTREDILSKIQSWICSTGEDVPRVLWLSGTAGTGKSAIAHTIANWSNEQGGIGACFCFDRTRGADRRHEKIFTTIARDLADCDPTVRRALARAVHDRNELRHTTDITRQWQELIVGPTGMASKDIAAPVLIVIEALDESGEANSREQILRLLAGKLDVSLSKVTELPANFRILVTSRPLRDIHDALHAAPHVQHVSLDDISSASTEHDIQLYISRRLEDLRNIFNDDHFEALALKSDGLFEWARLASEYIKSTNIVSRGPMRHFRDISETSAKGAHLLDEMYQRILADIIPVHMYEEVIPMFRSVMGQILASSEPLPITALTAMRQHFPCDDDRYDVNLLMGHLGSLVSGTSDPQTPIRPLHASFYEFLTDKSRGRDFFVDPSSVQSDLAFASLRVMEHGLRFNICSLETSYLPNSSVPGLEKRVQEFIPTELSYSCRFWGTHVGAASFEPSLAKEVEDLFDGERLLWWLEALALLKDLRGSVGTLSSITSWVMGHAGYMHISDAASDAQHFVRTFGATILYTTPHLYLSALPFAATQSMIFQKFAAKFPCTPRVVAGHVTKWPQIEKILHANEDVYSVTMSQDGKRIACGLGDGTIQVWDTETGEALGDPFEGHTKAVTSVAFLPDGNRIVSGSCDTTVRLWDAATGKELALFQGHTNFVNSIAISSDGKHLVSGSGDNTIRVWDVETGKSMGVPLQGHTSYVRSVAISQDGKFIVSGSEDMTVRVWDMGSGKALGAALQGHTDCVLSVAISQDGKFIVSGSNDHTIRVWDKETGKALGAPLQGHTGPVPSVAIFPDGNHIVSGSADQTIRVWDSKTGEALGPPLQGHTDTIFSVAISPDGNRIVSGSYDRTILVWDADTHTSEAFGTTLQGHTDFIGSVAISPDGNYIVSGSDDKTIRVWDMGTGKALGAAPQGHTDAVNSIAITQDGNRIVSGSDDNTIRVWDIGTGEALGPPFRGHTDWIWSVAISFDGKQIVSGSRDKMIGVWDVETMGDSVTYLRGHTEEVFSVAISRDGKHIVSGSGDKMIGIWDVETRTLATYLQGHTDEVVSIAISHDGKHIVSGSGDKTIGVWDMETKALVVYLRGHTMKVHSVAVSSDGKRIVSGSLDKTIRVWDMETHEALVSLQCHTGSFLSVAISPDDKHVVSSSSDRTIRVWDLEFLNRDQLLEAPAICFSSDPTHALCSPSSFLQGSRTPASLALTEEGWVIGPKGHILLSIPLHFHPAMYVPGNTLVIHNHPSQLDLRLFAHGMSWHKCREQETPRLRE